MLIAAKILLTLATPGYSAIPAMFDSNETHVTNPSFPGHARFHIVWQVSSYVYVALLALYLIWSAVASRDMYAGTLVSQVNPAPTFKWNLAGLKFQTDANMSLFAPALILVGLGAWALAQA